MPCEDEIEDLPTSSTVSSYPETVNPLLVTAGPWTPLSPTMPLEPDALLPSAFAEYFLNQQSPALYDNGAFEQLFAVSPDSLSPDAADQAQREFSIVKDDADEERPAKKKRTRRIFRAVQGNNKVGQKGKMICTNCRKIHSKCEYTLEDEPCQYCTRRKLKCEKVLGPKKARSVSSRSLGSSAISSPELAPATNSQVVSTPISLITDSELSDRELYLLRRLFRRHQSNRITSCVGVLLQNLWNTYGSVFVDKSLLYAALTFESYWNNYSESNHATGKWSPTGSWEYYTLKSRFHEFLSNAISENRISECNFFALFMASQSSLSGEASFKEDLNVYQQGMVRILKSLKETEENNDSNKKLQHLRSLHPFIFSFTRRILCRGDFSMPEYLVADTAMQTPPQAGMSKVAKKIPHVVNCLRDIPSNPILDSLDPQVHNVPYHNWDYWNEVICCLCREFDIMAECFQLALRPLSEWEYELDVVADSLIRTRDKIDNMLNWHDASYVFRAMHDAFEPKNVREGHPHVRGLINFLISLFRASALLSVLEFLLLGKVEQYRRRLFVEFRRAETDVAKYDRTVWSLRKTELLVAMALLLAPQLFPPEEHNVMLEHRLWLSEIWFEHHLDEKKRFSRCQDCPCRSLTRVQRLWSSDMTRGHYIQFLSENNWIWAVEPGWAMEEKLKNEPDTFERIYTPCSTCWDAKLAEGVICLPCTY